jgi:hypothetical protein
LILLLLACKGGPPTTPETGTDTPETGTPDSAAAERYQTVAVTVTLDGEPVEGATVSQGGSVARWTTGSDGTVTVTADTWVEGDLVIIASHPEARIQGNFPADGALTIPLTRLVDVDNTAFSFQDPGTPERNDDTGKCAHCHLTINADWVETPHADAASGVPLHDLYAGAAAAFADATACADAGGQWWAGLGPGTAAAADRCYLGDGVLPLLNTDCGETSSCDAVAAEVGDCADCHAPGIDGALGGRGLLEATGLAYDYGVHCDVCHKVESVDLTAPAGVCGRLRILRPTEESPSAGLGEWLPLTFGPYDDVINPRMGSVQRDHYKSADFCAGCHQHDQAVLVPGVSIDTDRWPDGVLPVHSTYDEWLEGPFADSAPCQSCHMPPDPDAGNSSDIDQMEPSALGVAGGWWRPPGEVRRHTWTGPRSDVADMLALAATLTVQAEAADGALTAAVTVRNIGPGHALPTGEPMRSMVLLVSATCDGETLSATGGAVVPDFGGYAAMKVAGEDWSVWPGAAVGQRVQVVQRTGGYLDYTGPGRFGDGSFSPEQRGMAEEVLLGAATITAIDGDTVTFDTPLPAGDVAYRLDGGGIPADGDPVAGLAGLPGFGFARVMVGADGARMVPHFAAVDIASDNRLPPQQAWTSQHTFAADCDEPTVTAALLYRSYPLDLAAQRGWELTERVMTTAEVRP